MTARAEEQVIEALEAEWSEETGFFGRLRQGHFEDASFRRTLAILRGISAEPDAMLPRRLVSLLWMVPSFMDWQVERVREAGGDVEAHGRGSSLIMNELERILGVP